MITTEERRYLRELAKKLSYMALDDKCLSLRYESREKLKKYRPENLSQASKISGVNPVDIAILAIYDH